MRQARCMEAFESLFQNLMHGSRLGDFQVLVRFGYLVVRDLLTIGYHLKESSSKLKVAKPEPKRIGFPAFFDASFSTYFS